MEEVAGLQPLRAVFMGTPDFAAEVLRHLAAWPGCELVGVYTQPDRPCGRGRHCQPSPVKTLALELGAPIFQPENFKNPEAVEELRALRPDVLVVAAYGLILPQAVLDVPRLMPLNVHASLLPKYRGAAPIQRAIEAGEVITGTTIMRMEAGLDTGPILLQRALRIGHDQHAGEIHDELAEQGGKMIVEALERLWRGALVEIPQDDAKSTYAPKLTKEEGEVDWNRPAQAVHDHIRAMYPWPGPFWFWSGRGEPLRLNVLPGRVGRELAEGEAAPGEILGEEEGLLAVACADKVYLTPGVKPQGRKELDATAFCCGYMSICK
ncbi:methionyl-tRNA formyltransferase [Paucidesulfovibrio longus]|uniref:methionyl-tRNA formyltransferase n=1 Tax=Paucidesulfovibrio longus TaxID=889 RepID=UPI0004821EC3|nr:methionyl-tRNA formyltransferase [Paucidesulfovibrio longus]